MLPWGRGAVTVARPLSCARAAASRPYAAAAAAAAASSRSAWLRQRLVDVAVAQVRSGDARAAQSSVDKALRLGLSPSPSAQVTLARVLAAAGDVEGARARLDSALTSTHDDRVCVAAADVLALLGDRERARQALDAVLVRRARDPRLQPTLAQVRARVLAARLRVDVGDVSDALVPELRDAVTLLRRMRGNEHVECLAALRVLATLLQLRAQLSEARTVLEYVGAVLQRNVAKVSEAQRAAVLAPIAAQHAEIVAALPAGASTRPHSVAPRAFRDAIVAADALGAVGEDAQPKWRLEKLRKKRKELNAQSLRTR